MNALNSHVRTMVHVSIVKALMNVTVQKDGQTIIVKQVILIQNNTKALEISTSILCLLINIMILIQEKRMQMKN